MGDDFLEWMRDRRVRRRRRALSSSVAVSVAAVGGAAWWVSCCAPWDRAESGDVYDPVTAVVDWDECGLVIDAGQQIWYQYDFPDGLASGMTGTLVVEGEVRPGEDELAATFSAGSIEVPFRTDGPWISCDW